LYKNKGKGLEMYKSIAADQTKYADHAERLLPDAYGLKVIYLGKTESEIGIARK
jgi:hypothetical protein